MLTMMEAKSREIIEHLKTRESEYEIRSCLKQDVGEQIDRLLFEGVSTLCQFVLIPQVKHAKTGFEGHAAVLYSRAF